MNVLYITNSMEIGGVETNLVGLTDELARRGHGVIVASSGGDLVQELEHRGIEHVRLPLSLRRPHLLPLAALRVRRVVARRSIDVVHAMSAAANLATLAAPRAAGTLYVSSPMGLQQSDTESVLITDMRNRFMVWGTHRVFLISEEIAAAVRRLRMDPRRLVEKNVVGIDVRSFETSEADRTVARTEIGVAANDRVVTTIGALHSRKRHDLFLRAAAEVLRDHRDTRFVIVGEGPERSALQALAEEVGISHSVVFTGNRRDIGRILAATDVYVRPGIVEGFIGITVMEAMAARRPVIAFAIRDVEPAVTDGETGLLVRLGDASALAAAIRSLLSDRALAARLAEGGRRRVVERFSLEAIAADLEATYGSLLQGLRKGAV